MVKYRYMKKSMQVRNGSVDRAGITKDYREAIKQFIWNAIEANAKEINIGFKKFFDEEELPTLKEFTIEDDGDGINYEEIETTFGSFLDSKKRSKFTKGGKGKGRLSFSAVSAKAVWYTTYTDKTDSKNYFYTITITNDDRENYEYDDKKRFVSTETGTKVAFTLLEGKFNYDDLVSEDFERYLALEFGWYLKVFDSNRVKIMLNGERLEYEKYITDSDSFSIEVQQDESSDKIVKFDVDYIAWSDKIGADSYIYLMNSGHELIGLQPTGFNSMGGRKYGFVHSIYVRSNYFNDFEIVNKGVTKNAALDLGLEKLNQHDEVYKKLKKQIKEYLEKRKQQFLKQGAETIIEKFAKNKTLPSFVDGPLGERQREDFEEVVKGVFTAAPTLLTGLNHEHEKTMLGFMQLTLKSDEREHILDIVGNVVELTPEERKDLAELLKRAKLSGVIKLLNMLRSRYAVIELLQALVLKHTKTATERGQVQEAIENNCWIFGEEYNLIGADEKFGVLRKKYLDYIDALKIDEAEKSDRRPDIFITRSKRISSGMTGGIHKKVNLLVELKRPSVVIGNEQYRQVEDYRNILRNDPNFDSEMREWHIYVIGLRLSDDVKAKREADAQRLFNRPFLVNNEGNYYIYAMTWAEVFDSFEVRHDYLLDDLEMDKSQLLKDAGINLETITAQETADLIVKNAPLKSTIAPTQ